MLDDSIQISFHVKGADFFDVSLVSCQDEIIFNDFWMAAASWSNPLKFLCFHSALSKVFKWYFASDDFDGFAAVHLA